MGKTRGYNGNGNPMKVDIDIWRSCWIGWAVILLGFVVANFALIIVNHNRHGGNGGEPVSLQQTQSEVEDETLEDIFLQITGDSTHYQGVAMAACVQECQSCASNQTESGIIMSTCAQECTCCKALEACAKRRTAPAIGARCIPAERSVCVPFFSGPCIFNPSAEICRNKGFDIPLPP